MLVRHTDLAFTTISTQNFITTFLTPEASVTGENVVPKDHSLKT
jgi:hypothetical protein